MVALNDLRLAMMCTQVRMCALLSKLTKGPLYIPESNVHALRVNLDLAIRKLFLVLEKFARGGKKLTQMAPAGVTAMPSHGYGPAFLVQIICLSVRRTIDSTDS